MADDAGEVSPGRQVAFATEPEHAKADLAKPDDLLRSSSDLLVANDHDKLPSRNSGHPLKIGRPERAFGDQGVPDVNRVTSGSTECFAKADRAFVDVEPQRLAIGRHVAAYAARMSS